MGEVGIYLTNLFLMIKIMQLHGMNKQWLEGQASSAFDPNSAQLVLVFGATSCIDDPYISPEVSKKFPNADVVFCSTAGEILNNTVYDNSTVVTALQFEHTKIKSFRLNIKDFSDSYSCGKALMNAVPKENLSCVFVISDGGLINGSELVKGISEVNPNNIPVTGGLAGDGARFERTLTGLNGPAEPGNVIAIGMYGDRLKISHGSFGGWDEFGHERTITKSEKNVLFEVDGKNALELYKEYLGPYSEELPGSALLFPLSLREDDSERKLVRTILSVDENSHSMTFAGNMPEGAKVRFMKANFDKIIDASATAASKTLADIMAHRPELAILISCVGRKLILQERVEEEVEAARNVFGPETFFTGFYSYGEISPFSPNASCDLHNQTMTITTFSEI